MIGEAARVEEVKNQRRVRQQPALARVIGRHATVVEQRFAAQQRRCNPRLLVQQREQTVRARGGFAAQQAIA